MTVASRHLGWTLLVSLSSLSACGEPVLVARELSIRLETDAGVTTRTHANSSDAPSSSMDSGTDSVALDAGSELEPDAGPKDESKHDDDSKDHDDEHD